MLINRKKDLSSDKSFFYTSIIRIIELYFYLVIDIYKKYDQMFIGRKFIFYGVNRLGLRPEAYVYGNYFWFIHIWDGTSLPHNACIDLTKSYGQHCTARVIEQGWEMTY